MKAIVYRDYGPPEVLQVAELDRPVPREGELLIRVHAAEATRGDCEMRSFRFAVKWFWLPLRLAMGLRRPGNPVLGGYFSGVVEAVGQNVDSFKTGDEVFGCGKLRAGAYAEYACYPASYTIVPKPENLSHAEAAACPLGGLNALHFMRRADISPGDKVLINGAGGSIGLFAVQIARSMGAEVTAVDHGRKEPLLRDVGADHFIDYRREDFAGAGQTWDVVFDMVVQSSYTACIRCLNPGGRYLMGNPRFLDMVRSAVTPLVTDKKVLFNFARETHEELQELKAMLEAGTIRPVIDTIYSMEEAAAAHRRVETEERLGMVVISMETRTVEAQG